MQRLLHFATISAIATLLVGCAASPSDNTFVVPNGEYPKAFDATRTVLREYRFSLERVDADAGVISTSSQQVAGLVAPWERVQTTAGSEIEDFVHQQSRRVRVTFAQAENGAMNATVVASMTTQAVDPALIDRGMAYRFDVVVSRDDALAAKLARAIERAMK
jgi:hypothetical protein